MAPAVLDFAGRALAGKRSFTPADLVDERTPFGLSREGTYLWGTLRSDDGELCSVMRRIPPAPAAEGADGGASDAGQALALGDRLMVLAAFDGGDALRLRREAKVAARSRDITRELRDGTAVLAAAASDQAAMRAEIGDTSFTYVEDGVLDLRGELACSPLHWYLPGRTASLYYPTQTYLVSGTALGRPVRGFLFVEEAYMLPGGVLYVRKDPLHDVNYLTWHSWATRWEDGRTEIGHVLFGAGDFHVGLVADDAGNVRSALTMDVGVTRAADGYWHDGIAVVMDGTAWELVPDPAGRMVDLGPIPNPQQESLMRRAGEVRQPDVWMAWGESLPKVGNRRISS
ncbi:conserved hypothetical protein [Frankia canadensis]|uniref:Uncharacterized protein n=1 Tax=Frankia canadensis TaxID=1836972 RepID=A0A2I2KNR9_9ACTN|nr:hypothetical protein [Frankia canadensis]SNQ47296.1 conserved hypothetical protein [Frankia canadensis]SOU54586.1 conserved hypothetical protein [Frankia canadensis]